MKYTVYKITNNLNGMFYIGKHQTQNLDDGYMGSGERIKYAINKYGKANFSKEILYIFDSEEEMNAKEKELVVICEQSYNICEGGLGVVGYKHTEKVKRFLSERKISFSKREKLAAARRGKPGHMAGKKHSLEARKKTSLKKKDYVPWNKGKQHSAETKNKISEALKKRKQGINHLVKIAAFDSA